MSWRMKLVPVLFVAVVVYVAVLPEFRVFQEVAEPLLLVAVAAAVVGGPERGAVIAFVCGLLADLFVRTPYGVSPLAFTLVAFAVGSLQTSFLRAVWWTVPVTVAFASAVSVLLFGTFAGMLGEGQLLNSDLVRTAVVVASLHGLFSPIAVRVMRWTLADADDPRIAIR